MEACGASDATLWIQTLLGLIDEEYKATKEEGDIKCLTSLIDRTKPRDVYFVRCRSEGNKALARLLKVATALTPSQLPEEKRNWMT